MTGPVVIRARHALAAIVTAREALAAHDFALLDLVLQELEHDVAELVGLLEARSAA